MEKRINKKVDNYISNFKESIKNQLISENFEDKNKVNDFLSFIYDFERLSLSKEDFVKRKRVKNTVPTINRCSAKRADGDQCTRRRKKDCEFCGTHSKGTPHGLVTENENAGAINEKMDVVAYEIKGIVYYIDKYNNVYNTEDILQGIENPRIIAKSKLDMNGNMCIPEFGLQ